MDNKRAIHLLIKAFEQGSVDRDFVESYMMELIDLNKTKGVIMGVLAAASVALVLFLILYFML